MNIGNWVRDNTIHSIVAGSRLYGTARPDSDIDIRGVCLAPPEVLLGLTGFQQYQGDSENDLVIYELRRFCSLSICVDSCGKKDRVEVSGDYPHYPRRKNGHNNGSPLRYDDTPRITCAIKRGHEAIAKDITRRFLDDHIDCHERAVELIAQNEQYMDDQEAIMLSLADIMGEEVRPHGSIYIKSGEIKPYGRDTVSIKLRSVPAHVAAQICKLLKEVA